jgi:hypothetical protein
MRRSLATLLVTVVAALGAVGSAAAAPPIAAERLCTAQGGIFILVEGISSYGCARELLDPDSYFSENQVTAARNVCEHVYRGSFTREEVAGVDLIFCDNATFS